MAPESSPNGVCVYIYTHSIGRNSKRPPLNYKHTLNYHTHPTNPCHLFGTLSQAPPSSPAAYSSRQCAPWQPSLYCGGTVMPSALAKVKS